MKYAQQNLLEIIKVVNQTDTSMEILDSLGSSQAVIMSVKEYRAIPETLYLMNDGTLNKVHKAMQDKSGEIDLTNGIDWNKI
ncbi:hypothetical protein FD31_GL000014 [Companilactobacillus nantensis DSM 16982]|uniref:Antitoxin n=2 Tax=Companilactobacillus nantensis TaxID=305793 RepID=A0A0R1WTQ1_9LACO|nr:hypothetical protein FD31_GL000014 [Companilactobacillus nantensis DSM 16982]